MQRIITDDVKNNYWADLPDVKLYFLLLLWKERLIGSDTSAIFFWKNNFCYFLILSCLYFNAYFPSPFSKIWWSLKSQHNCSLHVPMKSTCDWGYWAWALQLLAALPPVRVRGKILLRKAKALIPILALLRLERPWAFPSRVQADLHPRADQGAGGKAAHRQLPRRPPRLGGAGSAAELEQVIRKDRLKRKRSGGGRDARTAPRTSAQRAAEGEVNSGTVYML